MNRRLSAVQDPELTDRRRPADTEPPEALDPAAAFALGQWGVAKRLAQPGRSSRRRCVSKQALTCAAVYQWS